MKNFLGQRAIPVIQYHGPVELKQALDLISEFGERCKLIAGGTDLIPAIRRGALFLPNDSPVIDINFIKDLNYIVKDNNTLRIGAMTRLSEIERSDLIAKHAPVLAEAISQMASLQIRNRGTVGGNLCNASPAADSAPPLLVLDAMVKMRSVDKERVIPLKQFFIGPGKTVLAPNEILVEIQIPIIQTSWNSCFIKLGQRNAFTLSIVAVATIVKIKNRVFDDIKIALAAVAPIPIRALKVENQLIGKKATEKVVEDGAKAVLNEVKPISDVRASAEYRKDMSYILTKRAITSCLNKSLQTRYDR